MGKKHCWRQFIWGHNCNATMVDWETRTQTPVLAVTGKCQILCDGRWTPLSIQATSYVVVAVTFTNVSCLRSLLSLLYGRPRLMCSWGLERLIQERRQRLTGGFLGVGACVLRDSQIGIIGAFRWQKKTNAKHEYSSWCFAPLLGYYLVRAIKFISVPLRTNVLRLNHVWNWV